MPLLPERADLGQLRRRAKELLRAARNGDPAALERMAVSNRPLSLAWAQFALAREYGFATWADLTLEVRRRRAIDAGDVDALRSVLTAEPEMAWKPVRSLLSDREATALTYVGVARFHWMHDHDRVGAVTAALLDAGAPPDGLGGEGETPLITAASYGEVGMLRALIAAGADLERVGTAVPNATALGHAVEFGMTACVDVLVAAGAVVDGAANIAGSGHLDRLDPDGWSDHDRYLAWRAAARCGRIAVADRLRAGGVELEAHNGDHATALHWAAYHAQAAMVRHLLDLGANPNAVETSHGLTPLGWAEYRRGNIGGDWGHPDVIDLLKPVTESVG